MIHQADQADKNAVAAYHSQYLLGFELGTEMLGRRARAGKSGTRSSRQFNNLRFVTTSRLDEGQRCLDEALAKAQEVGEFFYSAELDRLKGTLTLQSQVESRESKVEEAEACFLKAIEIAHRQQAKSLELRAATSLARLWRQQGKQHEARTTLAEVYNWFTEGFETKDLQEAKVLLEELG